MHTSHIVHSSLKPQTGSERVSLFEYQARQEGLLKSSLIIDDTRVEHVLF
jgi:hypothetical protein